MLSTFIIIVFYLILMHPDRPGKLDSEKEESKSDSLKQADETVGKFLKW